LFVGGSVAAPLIEESGLMVIGSIVAAALWAAFAQPVLHDDAC